MTKPGITALLLLLVANLEAANVQYPPGYDPAADKYIRGKPTGLNDVQRQMILDEHNFYRRREGGSNMQKMEYDFSLEHFAQKAATACTRQESPSDQQHRPVAYHRGAIGENMEVEEEDRAWRADAAVTTWAAQGQHYDHTTQTCAEGNMCTQYTQIVNPMSNKVGCGVAYCDTWSSAPGFIMYCQYTDRATLRMWPRIQPGPECSKCPFYAPGCCDGLCDGRLKTNSSSSSSFALIPATRRTSRRTGA